MTTEAFVAALREQKEKYREMVGLVEGQTALMASGEPDALMGLVERKQALMGEIEVLEKDLAPVRAKWPELRTRLDAGAIGDVETAVGETRSVLQRLVTLEEEGQALLMQRRSTAEDRIKDLMTKKKARGAYGAYGGEAGEDPRFLDRTQYQ